MKYTLLLLLTGVSIGLQAQKKVLVEQFTNSGCPPCATYTPQVVDYVMANRNNVIMISYHTSFPYLDSMYHENKVENNAAVSAYSISGVPSTVVDGNQFNGSSSNFVSGADAVVAPRAGAGEFGKITTSGFSLVNNKLDINVSVALQPNLVPSEYVLKVVVVEEKVLKSAYAASPGKNTETEYCYVMRKMLPGFEGVSLTSSGYQEKYSWNLENIKNPAEIRVITFLQKKSTKEVGAVEITGSQTSGILKTEPDSGRLSIYPNPSNGFVNIRFTGEANSSLLLRVYNETGALVSEQPLTADRETRINISDLSRGVFLFEVSENGKPLAVKRFLN